jgi:hypothetical protein
MGYNTYKAFQALLVSEEERTTFLNKLNRWNRFLFKDLTESSVSFVEEWGTSELQMTVLLTLTAESFKIQCSGTNALTGYTVEHEHSWDSRPEHHVHDMNVCIEDAQRQLLLSRFEAWPIKEVTLHMVCEDLLKSAKRLATAVLPR